MPRRFNALIIIDCMTFMFHYLSYLFNFNFASELRISEVNHILIVD